MIWSDEPYWFDGEDFETEWDVDQRIHFIDRADGWKQNLCCKINPVIKCLSCNYFMCRTCRANIWREDVVPTVLTGDLWLHNHFSSNCNKEQLTKLRWIK